MPAVEPTSNRGAHRLPTGAYPMIGARADPEQDDRAGDLFRPAHRAERPEAEPTPQDRAAIGTEPDRRAPGQSVQPAARTNDQAAVSVSAGRPPAAADATVLSPPVTSAPTSGVNVSEDPPSGRPSDADPATATNGSDRSRSTPATRSG